jgi:hypothetical protein
LQWLAENIQSVNLSDYTAPAPPRNSISGSRSNGQRSAIVTVATILVQTLISRRAGSRNGASPNSPRRQILNKMPACGGSHRPPQN